MYIHEDMEKLANEMMERIHELTAENKALRMKNIDKDKEIEKLKRRIENGYDSDDDDINFCDSCQSPATRECDGWDLCDKCYLRHKYQE